MRIVVTAAFVLLAAARTSAGAPCTRQGIDRELAALGAPRLDELGPRVDVELRGAGRRREGRVTYVTSSGEVVGPRIVEARSCRELERSLALVIAMSVQRDEPAGTPVLPVVPVAEVEPRTAAVAVVPVADVAPRKSRSTTVVLGGAGDVTGRPAFVVGARWRRAAVSIGIEAQLRSPQTLDVGGGGELRIARGFVDLVPCFHVGRAAMCGIAAAGALRGSAQDLAQATSVTRAAFAVGGRAELTISAGPRLGVRLHVDALQALTNARFMVDQMTVWSSAPREIWVGAGVVANFP